LEKEARLFLNLEHLSTLVLAGRWDKVEKHLNAFLPLAFTEHDLATNNLLSLIKREQFLHFLHAYALTKSL
jgi:hypothetical protein